MMIKNVTQPYVGDQTALTTTQKQLVGAVNELDALIGAAASSSGSIGTSIDTDGTLKASAVDVAAVISDTIITDAKLVPDIKVGSLAALSTTAKSSVVAAINELTGKVGGSGWTALIPYFVDTENKLYLDGNRAILNGGKASPGWGDPGVILASRARVVGDTIIVKLNSNNNDIRVGWLSSPSALYDGFDIQTSTLRLLYGATVNDGFPTLSPNEEYNLIVIRRATSGAFMMIQGGDYPHPELLFLSNKGTQNSIPSGVMNYDANVSVGNIQILPTAWVPTPLVSDGFSTTSSDGLGHQESAGLGAGGSGAAWVDAIGTWGASGGSRAASVLSGGVAINSTVLSTADAIVHVALTRSAGSTGIIVRYVDSSNYVYALCDGTTVKLRKVIAGVDTLLISGAVTYGNGKVLMVVCSGTRFDLYYDYARVGSAVTITDSALDGAKKVGLYTTDVNNTFDNFVAYARGTSNEYKALAWQLNGDDIPARNNIWHIGDSKTLPTLDNQTLCQDLVTATGRYWYQSWVPGGLSSYRVGQILTYWEEHLGEIKSAPTHICINAAANDALVTLDETAFKASYNALIDLLLAKWPMATILLMRVWRRSYASECDSLDEWIDDIIAARGEVYAGPDERVFLENGDDGATYTADGTHPNAAGYTLTAHEWATSILAI